jgi:hypothetical protein
MLNFAGQDIHKGTFVVQIARTNQGIVRRVGVVLGVEATDEGSRFRTAWSDPEVEDTSVSESIVSLDNLVRIDPNTIPNTVRYPLEYALLRGRAAL